MLEDESTATANDMQVLFHEKILPDLSKNIICGNSLIGTDILDGKMFATDEERKLNPMDFDKRFPEIMKSGGFDAIVGNPPYVRQEQLGNIKEYLTEHYEVFIGMADLYSYFIEKGMKLLNNNGHFGYIVANKWMRANYGKNLREFLLKYNLIQIIDFGDLPVFKNATTYPCILIVNKTDKENKSNINFLNVKDLEFSSLTDYYNENVQAISKQFLKSDVWNLVSDTENTLLDKLNKSGIQLNEYVAGKIFRGLLTGLNEAFVIDEKTKNELIAKDNRSAEIIKPFLTGREIKRYNPLYPENYLIFFPKGFTNDKGNRPKDAWNWLKENYTAIAEYLEPFEKKGKFRYDKGDYWWELRACDYYSEFDKPKIILPDIALRMQATLDSYKNYCVNTAYIIPVDDLFLLAVMNSRLVNFYYSALSPSIRGGYFRFIRQYIEQIPIIKINFQNESEKQSHDRIVTLVNQMLVTKKHLQTVKTDKDKTYFENKCADLDRSIEAEVYSLYGLTDEEIKIVEGNN
jgi:hypothetical protein